MEEWYRNMKYVLPSLAIGHNLQKWSVKEK